MTDESENSPIQKRLPNGARRTSAAPRAGILSVEDSQTECD